MAERSSNGPSRTSQVLAAVIGNGLEWYDYGIYAYFAATIAKVFFPTGDAYLGLLLAFATFGVGFLTRPIGGILIGAYADKKGRKKALELIIGLMGVGLLIIILTPSYASIGIAAPILVVCSRLFKAWLPVASLRPPRPFSLKLRRTIARGSMARGRWRGKRQRVSWAC